MDLDLSTEHDQWDNTESLTIEIARGPSQVQRDATSATDSIPLAKRRAPTTREQAASGGVYTSQDLVWHVPAVLLTPGLTPKVGDVLIDSDGARWTVLEATRNRARQTFKLTSRNLAIAYALQDTLDVQRAIIGRDAAGAPTKTFPPDGGKIVYQALPCRVQLVNQAVVDERGIRGRQSTYAITVDRQIDVDTEDRIVWGKKILDIVGVRNPELITELPCIDALEKV